MGHIKSKSYTIDGKETLIPTVNPKTGDQMSDAEAIQSYVSGKTKALGRFDTIEEANNYSKKHSQRSGLNRMNPSFTGRKR